MLYQDHTLKSPGQLYCSSVQQNWNPTWNLGFGLEKNADLKTFLYSILDFVLH